MSLAVGLGTGASVTFTVSSFAGEITDISGPSSSRPSIDTTHLGTTLARTFIPGDLVDNGEVDLTIHFDADTAIPTGTAAETIEILFKLESGESTATKWSFTGFVIDHTPVIPLDDKMTATVTIKISGVITITVAT